MHCSTGRCVSHMIASALWTQLWVCVWEGGRGSYGGIINKIFSTVINRMVVTLWSCCTVTLRDFSNQACLCTRSDLLNLKVWFTLPSHAFFIFIFYIFVCLPCSSCLLSRLFLVICCTYFFLSPAFWLSFHLLIALLLSILFLLFVRLPVGMCAVVGDWERV